jgi:CheY-like chemotaxis protein
MEPQSETQFDLSFDDTSSRSLNTASEAPVSLSPASPLITVLLVEDDVILQGLYYDRFVRSGFEVLQAFDGVEALEMIQKRPDIMLVLLDLMLPKLSGFDVLMHIRGMMHNATLPIVVVSALSDIDDQARALQLGANEYITKGEVLPGTVIEKIHKYALSVQRPAQ